MTRTYPDISIQSAIDPSPWWIDDNVKNLERGRLIRVFVPYIDQAPLQLAVVGRADPTHHNEAFYRIEPLKIKTAKRTNVLPVAAIPEYRGEARIVQRAKKRPVVILGEGGLRVPEAFTANRPKWLFSRTLLIAPYFGADQDGTRGGCPPAFLERVRLCEFPQFMFDMLPLGGPSESLLRFDQIQSIGADKDSIEITKFHLSKDAIAIVDEWVQWAITGFLSEDGLIHMARSTFLEMKSAS